MGPIMRGPRHTNITPTSHRCSSPGIGARNSWQTSAWFSFVTPSSYAWGQEPIWNAGRANAEVEGLMTGFDFTYRYQPDTATLDRAVLRRAQRLAGNLAPDSRCQRKAKPRGHHLTVALTETILAASLDEVTPVGKVSGAWQTLVATEERRRPWR